MTQRHNQWEDTVLGKLERMEQQLSQLLKQQGQLMSRASLAVNPEHNNNGNTGATDALTGITLTASNTTVNSSAPPHEMIPAPTNSNWWITMGADGDVDWEDPAEANELPAKTVSAVESEIEGNGHLDGTPYSYPSNPSSKADSLMRITQSSKPYVNNGAEMAETELLHILIDNTEVKRMQRAQSQKVVARIGEQAASWKYIYRFAMKMNAKKFELLMDSCIGAVICANALFIGFSMDADSSSSTGYMAAEICFTVIFWAENVLKLYIHGCRDHYCGKDWFSNCFDTAVISVDTVQLFLLIAFNDDDDDESSGFNASIFRVVRLVRLTRILRLLRSQVFKDLLSMIQGMIGGMSTLLWAVAFFVIFIYIVALIFRELLGKSRDTGDEDIAFVHQAFASVPRSMFTIFRCSFGDCSTKSGTPLFEHVTLTHGWFWSLTYMSFTFVVVIGLFNVISAIFVESTLASAATLAAKRREEKLENKHRWAENVVTLLTSLLSVHQSDMEELADLAEGEYTDDALNTLLRKLMHMRFKRSVIDYVVLNDNEALRALTKLDIDPADHKYLSDILDPENTGVVSTPSLVDGLKRLRGEPRRSDIITIDLMMRSNQKKVDDIWRWTKEIVRKSTSNRGTSLSTNFK